VANCRIINAVSECVSVRSGELPVLIDTLRASSTIVVALSHGIKRIIPLHDNQQPQDFESCDVLTIGESGGEQLPGFEAGNSPAKLVDILTSTPRETIAMRTSNLIPLLIKQEHAVICSNINVRAVAEYCMDKNVCIIAAGGGWGQAEDLSVALALGALIGGAKFDTDALSCFVRESGAARHLQDLGFQADVDFIVDSSQYDVVPMYDGKEIRNVKHS